tara:strand:- start:210 stop:452 length:243 start_codon:yes stop_codon:yes gene_type:complete
LIIGRSGPPLITKQLALLVADFAKGSKSVRVSGVVGELGRGISLISEKKVVFTRILYEKEDLEEVEITIAPPSWGWDWVV